MASAPQPVTLPNWAQVGEPRRAHIERVTALLDAWADALSVPPEEARAWHDAGQWHDALRDAPDDELRALTGVSTGPAKLLHGPAAALLLARGGESRPDVLAAVRHHTIGWGEWERTGRALYMADFLEPGRRFGRADRAFLAGLVPRDFDGVFRQVVRARIEWALREGHPVFEQTIGLWNRLQ